MKAFIRRIQVHPRYNKTVEWGKLVTITGSAQIVIQVLSLITGILIIRLLPTSEYAFYTIANTMLGTMSVLSDGGITAGVMAQGGKVWNNKIKLSAVLASGLKLRKKFGIIAIGISSPILIYLLLDHGASWTMTILITISLIPAFLATLSDSLLEIPPKLHQDISRLQKNGLAAAIGRLLLSSLAIFAFPFTFLALIAGGIPRIWANMQLKKMSTSYIDHDNTSDPEIEKNILRVVKRILPNSIYFCVSSQITIWLISIFGSTESVAQLGALGRLSMILSIFTALFQILIIPRYARLPGDRRIILKWFILIQIILFIFALIVVAVAELFSTQILWVIGDSYRGLEKTFVLAITSAVIGTMAGVLYGLLVARNWIMHPALGILTGILTQIILIISLDLSSLMGVYYFSIINAIVGILITYFYVFLLANSKKVL